MQQSEIDVRSVYETHARSCDPKDFQTQVMRPADEGQVALIVDGTVKALDLRPDDVVLDLCCGNGAISHLVFRRCRRGVGVDFTPYLIEVAKANFESPPECLFQLADALEYVETADDAERFSKVMCYGAFQCLPGPKAKALLAALHRRYPNLQRVFLGNLPDLDRVESFWQQDLHWRPDMGSEPWPRSDLKRHDTLFGIWRNQKEITRLADECGWRTQISRMASPFYAAHYRFDAILTKY